MRCFLALFTVMFSFLCAEKGIVVSLNDGYADCYFLGSLYHLRNKLGCHLPIEIWHDGDELSKGMKKKLKKFSNITFCDFQKKFHGAYGSLRGWQSKPFMLLGTRFDEVCLIDADVYFFADPKEVFASKKYLKTGAFFFRDRLVPFPQDGGPCDVNLYLSKRDLYRYFIEIPSKYVPPSFLHMWNEDRIPTLDNVLYGDLQEAGCLFLNKKRHKKGISKIIDLTNERHLTNIYKILHGDKETYWLGLEIEEEPYNFNDFIPCRIESNNLLTDMVHFFQGQLFFQQKAPIDVGNEVYFQGRTVSGNLWGRGATKGEVKVLHEAYKSYKKYHTR